jgi:ABC-type Mn2+/Zn2+ transport system permease subunit/Mn-dependent DtxR family transcriptional regulator
VTGVLAQLEFDWSQWSVPFAAQWWQETTCSVLVGIACGVLGCYVVLRRMALIGDALSHAVLPGVVIAFLITGNTGIGGLFFGALLAGLVTAGLIKLVSQFSRTKEDSAIGIVFTALFALGIVLISSLPRGTHFDLKCFLFGDPLAVGTDDLIMMAIIAPMVIAIVVLLYHPLKLASFDPVVAAAMGISVTALHYLLMGMLSATVVAGLKTTGVILVVAMVITPASAAYQLTNRLAPMLVLAGLFGAVSAAMGMALAFVTNSPTGPAMVLVATSIFAGAMILSPSEGVLFRMLRRHQIKLHIASEDVLKAVYRLAEARVACTVGAIVNRVELSLTSVNVALKTLTNEACVEMHSREVRLTPDGKQRAIGLVRAHRLWESYLVEEAGIGLDAIHTEAERLEHAHHLAEEIDKKLGHPQRDPHGTIIPTN